MEKRAAIETARQSSYPKAGPGFEWTVLALASWLIGAAYLDAWAHLHRKPESFFTPYHGVLYAAMFASVAFLGRHAQRSLHRGYPWRRALPRGYVLCLVGAVAFGVFGVADMIWHLIFGIEVSIQALLSPTHLLLAMSAGLIAMGPLRAAWLGQEKSVGYGPVLSAALSLALLVFFANYGQPFAFLYGAGTSGPLSDVEVGILGILIQAALLSVMVLMVIERFRVPLGSFTLIVGLEVVLLSLLEGHALQMSVVAVTAGVTLDVLYRVLRPSAERLGALRLFSFALPSVLMLAYFLDVLADQGIWWSVHFWTGAIGQAGIVGWLMSYLVVRPAHQSHRVS